MTSEPLIVDADYYKDHPLANGKIPAILCIRNMVNRTEWRYGTQWLNDNFANLRWAAGRQYNVLARELRRMSTTGSPRIPTAMINLHLHGIPVRQDLSVPDDTIFLVRLLKPYGEELLGTIFHLD